MGLLKIIRKKPVPDPPPDPPPEALVIRDLVRSGPPNKVSVEPKRDLVILEWVALHGKCIFHMWGDFVNLGIYRDSRPGGISWYEVPYTFIPEAWDLRERMLQEVPKDDFAFASSVAAEISRK